MTSYSSTKESAAAVAAAEALATTGAATATATIATATGSDSLDFRNEKCFEYDCFDSFSDGREKADTTPENLKKIDDAIEEASAGAGARFWRNHSASNVVVVTAHAVRDDDESLLAKLDNQRSRQQQANNVNDSFYRIESAANISPTTTITPTAITPTATTPTTAAVTFEESSVEESTPSGDTATRHSFAFTIVNFGEKECDPSVTQAKYKNMLERFQQRHRRGASMSKLENGSARESSLTMSNSATVTTQSKSTLTAHSAYSEHSDAAAAAAAATTPKVKLRARSSSRLRDASKRHSWSPRSSNSEDQQQQSQQQQQFRASKNVAARHSATTAAAMPPQSARRANSSARSRTLQMSKDGAGDATTQRQSTQFTPRSTAMQLALHKVDFLCAQPPLADFKREFNSLDADNISDAGTYTLDGDNYTEEQKDLMNIDSNGLERANRALRNAANAMQSRLARPTALELRGLYCDDVSEAMSASTQQQQQSVANSYLAKIKSRVLRNMCVTKQAAQQQSSSSSGSAIINAEIDNVKAAARRVIDDDADDDDDDDDVGTFTSVTTSGVLAKQCALDARPKLTRRSSLSTSQIDSSEYISNAVKLQQQQQQLLQQQQQQQQQQGSGNIGIGCFTDHQKAEYRLNVFTNQKHSAPQQKQAQQQKQQQQKRTLLQQTPTATSVYKAAIDGKDKLSDAALLKTAHSKNDWIQEWARNARARSLACSSAESGKGIKQTTELMTRSYTCAEREGKGGGGGSGSSVAVAQREMAAASLTDIESALYAPFRVSNKNNGKSNNCSSSNNNNNNKSNNKKSNNISNIERNNKSLATRYRLVGNGELDYASDPAISTSSSAYCFAYAVDSNKSGGDTRPPKSPSKIPSPLHSLGRTRSASRTRASLQNIFQTEATLDDAGGDGYGYGDEANNCLERTAAAINNLQQNLSRKNSLKSSAASSSSPAHSGTPRAATKLCRKSVAAAKHAAFYSNARNDGADNDDDNDNNDDIVDINDDDVVDVNDDDDDDVVNNDEAEQPHNYHLMTSSYNEQQLQLLTGANRQSMRARKNSCDGKLQLLLPNSPLARRNNWTNGTNNTNNTNNGSSNSSSRARKATQQQQQQQPQSLSPLRRSNSYSTKMATATRAATAPTKTRPQYQNLYTPPAMRHNYATTRQQPNVKKSASSNNFGNNYDGSDYEEQQSYYIRDADDDYDDDDDVADHAYVNDDDDDDDEEDSEQLGRQQYYSSGDDEEEEEAHYLYTAIADNSPTEPSAATRLQRTVGGEENANHGAPLTNTRCNKALLMRIERSKQKVAAAAAAATTTRTTACGLVACPNTPELPRRRRCNMKSTTAMTTTTTHAANVMRPHTARQSMPRDTSLSRLAGQIPNSLASAKKQLLQTAAVLPLKTATAAVTSATRIQPKYLDISKYKPVQGNSFLRKNDAKSTLKSESMIRRSPSSSSMAAAAAPLSRSEATRASNRSAKSANAAMTSSGTMLTTRATSMGRREASVAKQKEAELEMWKRRAKYDPMKAAAEDRRKREEAKRMAQTKSEYASESAHQQQQEQQQSNALLRQVSGENQWSLGLQEDDDDVNDEELSP